MDVAERVGDRLRETDATLSTAESLTGGLIGSTITAVPGASDYFDRGYVTYAYDAKREVLGMSREALDEHGAVSAPVAEAMARGARDHADVTWGVSATGIAGPTGGVEGKPVGTVYVGVAYAAEWGSGDSYATTRRHEFDGDRRTVRKRSVRAALELLLEEIE